MGAYHTDLAKNVARCRDSEVRIQRALKLANVDLGCLNVMAFPSLFLHFFRQLVFPCSCLIRGTIPTSVLVLVENIFTPFIYTGSRVKGWHELAENEKVLRIMDRACCDEAVARAVESLWKKRFVADVPIPHQT